MLGEYVRSITPKNVVPEKDLVKIGTRIFLRNVSLDVPKHAVAAGLYLGSTQNNKFVPSLNLLERVLPLTDRWVVVNDKAEWLVICGRDVWGPSILERGAEFTVDERVLVLSKRRDILGVGRIVGKDFSKKDVAVKMQFDIGDLIRRGRKLLQNRE